jgi:hypothetical protein
VTGAEILAQIEAHHRIYISTAAAVPGVQAMIETRLRVQTSVEKEGGWAIYFDAPRNADLDFLRPHILPPKKEQP